MNLVPKISISSVNLFPGCLIPTLIAGVCALFIHPTPVTGRINLIAFRIHIPYKDAFRVRQKYQEFNRSPK
jgi:hypothetical protein